MTEDGRQVRGHLSELDLEDGKGLVLPKSGEEQAWLLDGQRRSGWPEPGRGRQAEEQGRAPPS